MHYNIIGETGEHESHFFVQVTGDRSTNHILQAVLV